MAEPTSPDHAAFRRRIPGYRLGLLDESAAEGMRAHAAECAECRDLLAEAEDVARGDAAEGRHLPASLIARWSRAQGELRGLERAMVARHLERCAECRQELELLGHAPMLEAAPLVTPAGEGMLSRAAAEVREGVADGTERAVRVVVERTRAGRDWIRVALGGWALAASAAAVLLIARPPGQVAVPPGPGSGESATNLPGEQTPGIVTPPAGTPSTGSPAPSTTAGAGGSSALALAQFVGYEITVRSEGDVEAPATRVERATRALALEIPVEGLPAAGGGARVEIEVRAPSGAVAYEHRATLGELLANRLIVVPLGNRPVESGTYQVTFRIAGGDSATRRFRLEAATR